MAVLILRSLGAIFVSLALAFLLVVGVEIYSSILHPLPPGVDPYDMEACRAHVANYPAGVLFGAGILWAATVFAATWVATRLGTRRHIAHGLFVGLVLLAAAGFNIAMLPYPVWYTALVVISFPLMTWLGIRQARRTSPPTA